MIITSSSHSNLITLSQVAIIHNSKAVSHLNISSFISYQHLLKIPIFLTSISFIFKGSIHSFIDCLFEIMAIFGKSKFKGIIGNYRPCCGGSFLISHVKGDYIYATLTGVCAIITCAKFSDPMLILLFL